MANTIPLSVPDDLLEEVRRAAEQTHLSVQDVFRQSTRLGLPKLCQQHAGTTGRITNVDPLPDEVMDRIYSNPDRDEDESVQRFIAAQPLGTE